MESYSTQTTTPGSSSSTDDRQSQALRASVLDVALQLGFGTSSGIDRWLDGGDSADDPGVSSKPFYLAFIVLRMYTYSHRPCPLQH